MKNLVDADTYLMKLIRYVALNPGRAGMVDHPEKWPWSSYNAMVGKFQRRPPVLPLEKIAQAHANRNKAIVAIYATGEYSYLEIAAFSNIHFTIVDKIARAVKMNNRK